MNFLMNQKWNFSPQLCLVDTPSLTTWLQVFLVATIHCQALSIHRAVAFSQPLVNTQSLMSLLHPVPLTMLACSQMQASRARSRPSRKNLYEALLPVSDDWKSLGVLLDCDYPTLQDFEKRKQKDRTCLLEMVDRLLRKINMSWELVVEAVKKLGHEYQAQVIMQQFVSS